jgi:hypothetical protein
MTRRIVVHTGNGPHELDSESAGELQRIADRRGLSLAHALRELIREAHQRLASKN